MRRGEYQPGIALTDRYAQLQERAREMATELRYYKGRCELLGKRLERVGVEFEKLKGRQVRMEKIRVQLDAGAFAPQRAHEWDAGYDLRSRDDVTVWAEDSAVFETGVHIEIPKGYCGQVWSKSGLYVKRGITATGLIDAGYSGAIVVKLENHSLIPLRINRGDKIAQLVIVPCAGPEIELTDAIEGGERGNNGFGSTGR